MGLHIFIAECNLSDSGGRYAWQKDRTNVNLIRAQMKWLSSVTIKDGLSIIEQRMQATAYKDHKRQGFGIYGALILFPGRATALRVIVHKKNILDSTEFGFKTGPSTLVIRVIPSKY